MLRPRRALRWPSRAPVLGTAHAIQAGMSKLIPLKQVPSFARAAEAAARRKHLTRAAALEAATFEIIEAPGTYSGAYPRTIGWCLTNAAAVEMVRASVVRMPGGTQHRAYALRNT